MPLYIKINHVQNEVKTSMIIFLQNSVPKLLGNEMLHVFMMNDESPCFSSSENTFTLQRAKF